MSKVFFILFCAFSGGFCYRIRGGFIPTKSTLYARLVAWALPCAALIFETLLWRGEIWWQALLVGVGVFLTAWFGLLIPHGRFQDMSHGEKLNDFFGMSLVGLARNTMLVAPALYFNWKLVFLIPMSYLHGLSYLLANIFLFSRRIEWIKIPKSKPDMIPPARDAMDAKFSVAFQGYTDYAEFVVGFYTFACLSILMLL